MDATGDSSEASSLVPDLDAGGPPMPVRQLLEHEMEAGLRELDRPARGLMLSGLSAGLDIGFGPMLMSVLLTLSVGMPEVLRALLGAGAYAIGFVFVVLGRSELFTEHTTLAVFPVLDRRASLRGLGRLWTLVYVSNVVGALASGALGALILTSLGVADPREIAAMAREVVDHSWWTILVSAVLAGWLMGLLSWLSRTTRATLGLMVVVLVVTMTIGIAKLHHCIAGAAEVTMAIVAGSPRVTVAKLAHFMLWATIGNIIGGTVFVALIKLGHARLPSRRE